MTRLQIQSSIVLAGIAFAMPSSAQLIHKYTFASTGTVVSDSVGSVDGVLLGGATQDGTGRLQLDGVDDYVEFPPGYLGTLASATFEAWYTWTDLDEPNWARVMDFGDSSGGVGGQGFGLTYVALTPKSSDSGTPTAAVRLMPSGSSTKGLAADPPLVGVETHIALSIDAAAGQIKLYVDGVLEDTTPITLDLTSLVDDNNWLGRAQFQTNPYFEGSLTEFRVYGNALTDAQVAASFAVGADPTAVGQSYCGPGAPNSIGMSAAMFGLGSTEAADNQLEIGATGLPPFSFSFFIVSTAQGFVTQPGGSQGNLCLSGAIGRYTGPGQIQQSNLAGNIALTLDITQTPQPLGFVSVTAGETWNYQAWYRDSTPAGASSNFTDGLSVTFN